MRWRSRAHRNGVGGNGASATVRLPAPGDVRSLDALESLCFSDPWPGHFFLAEIGAPGRFHRVAVDEHGWLIGYLFAAWQYLDLHILKIATHPQLRRHGLGRYLMYLAEEHAIAMSGESLTLEVRPQNHPAIGLYTAIGYVSAGRRPRYYADGEDAVIMTKKLVVNHSEPGGDEVDMIDDVREEGSG